MYYNEYHEYSVKHRLEFTDELDRNKRVDVLQRGYSGETVHERIGAGFSPVSISLQNIGDPKYQTVKSTLIDLSVFSNNFEFQDISQAGDRDYKIEVWEESNEYGYEGWRLKHVGYVIPEIYSEPYIIEPYGINLRASSLGVLKNIRYTDEYGGLTTGIVPIIDVITTCLNKLGFGLDIWDSVNTYETRQDYGDSPLSHIKVDQSAYIVEERGRVKALSCLDVLERVLKPYVVNFFMDYGRWVIIPIELRAGERSVRVYNQFGDVVESFVHDPLDNNYTWLNQDQRLEFRPIIREVESVYEHGELGNIIPGGEFNDFYIPDPFWLFFSLPDQWEVSDINDFEQSFPFQTVSRTPIPESEGGPYGLRLRRKDSTDDAYIWTTNNREIEIGPDDVLRFVIKYTAVASALVELRFMVKIGTYYLQADGTFTTTPTNLVYQDQGDGDVGTIINIAGPFRDYGFGTQQTVPVGELEIRVYVPLSTSGSTEVEVVYPYIRLEYLPEGGKETGSENFFGERDVDTYADEIQYDLHHGDGPTNLHKTSFLIDSEYGDDRMTKSWTRGSLTGGIIDIAVNAIFNEYWTQSWAIRGTQRVRSLFDRWFHEFGRAYVPVAGSYDERFCDWNGELLQVLSVDPFAYLSCEVCIQIDGQYLFTWTAWEQTEESESVDTPAPSPDPEPQPVQPGSPGAPAEPTGGTQVLIMFVEPGQTYAFGTPVDVKLNGTWYSFHGKSQGDGIWDSSLGGGRGLVVNMNEILTSVEFKPAQLQVQGLNAHGFGFWTYKIFNKHPDANLYNQQIGGSGINRWENNAGAGRLIGRCGFNQTHQPDPNFYQFAVPSTYTSTGKMMIVASGYGINNPNFKCCECELA